MHRCSDSHKSLRRSPTDSRVHSYSRERQQTLEESKRSRYCRYNSSRDRSRSHDARRDHYHHQSSSSSRSRPNSPYRTVRPNSSRRYKSPYVHDTSVHTKNMPAELKLITHDATYFLLKSNNYDNLLLAKAESVWSTPPQNEVRINNAFKSKGNVILIFCVKDSSSFQGFARVSAESNKSYPPLPWVLPVGLSAKALSSVFTLDWICREELPFAQVRHLHNSVNMDRPVYVGRDGQELDAESGQEVCRRFSVDWGCADAQRAADKARLTLALRNVDVDRIVQSESTSRR